MKAEDQKLLDSIREEQIAHLREGFNQTTKLLLDMTQKYCETKTALEKAEHRILELENNQNYDHKRTKRTSR